MDSAEQARNRFREFAWTIGGDIIVSISIYADESHDVSRSEGYVIGGWVAPVEKWVEFCGSWQSALTGERTPYIHMRELSLEARKKEGSRFPLCDWPFTRVDAVLRKMIPVAAGHATFGVACAIEAAKYDDLPEVVRKCYRTPYALAFQAFYEQILRVLDGDSPIRHNIPANASCALIFDKVDMDIKREAEFAASELPKYKKGGDRFRSIAFLDDTPNESGIVDPHTLPLQAADVLANVSFRGYQKYIEENANVKTYDWDTLAARSGNLLRVAIAKAQIQDFAERIARRMEGNVNRTN